METKTDTHHIYYDQQVNSVVMEWYGYATSNQFKEGTELMLNTLIKNNAHKVLADIKRMVIIGTEDQEWLEKDFIPRAIQFGFKSIAIVRPDSYFNKVAVENVSINVHKKLNIRLFDDTGQASEWLASV